MTMGIEGLGPGGMSTDAVEAAALADDLGGLDELRTTVEENDRRNRIAREIEEMMAAFAAGTVDANAILLMCQNRLTDLDSQISGIMTDLADSSARAAEVGERLGELRNLQEWLRENTSTSGAGWGNTELRGPDYEITMETARRWIEASGRDPDSVDYAATLRAAGMPESDVLRITTPGAVDRYRLGERLTEEGVDVARLGSALAAAPEPLTRDAVREILVDHGVAAEVAAGIAERLPAARGVQSDVRTWMHLNGYGEFSSPAALNDEITALNEELSSVNSGNEMLMIKLQTLMQQRTSVLQMASNMLKALDEATDTMVGNLR